MRVILIDNGTSYINKLERLLHNYCSEVRVYSNGSIELQDIEASDLVVLSGGHMHPVLGYEHVYHREIEIIKQHEGSILGVCLGFQLIAHTFGAELKRLDSKRKGNMPIEITDVELVGQSNRIEVHESHKWSVPAVSSPLVPLAYSGDGVEIIKHATRPIYAMQFHPEVGDNPEVTRLFHLIMNKLSK